MITIVLADDHPIVRQGLRGILDSAPDLQVIREAQDGQEAVQITERLKPDVLIVDLMMPGMSGLDVVRLLRKRVPTTRCLVFSMYQDEAYVLQALKNGAAGYMLKESLSSSIVQAVHDVASGYRYLSPPLTERAIDAYIEKGAETAPDPYGRLTDREREILHMIVDGKSNAEMSARLSISIRTIETHRLHLMRKLGVKSHAELIHHALRHGLMPLEN